MVMRIDPANTRAAILSFPRDLWVEIAGSGRSSRLNSAYVKDDPRKLIETILLNFQVGIDHFVQVDFCAFNGSSTRSTVSRCRSRSPPVTATRGSTCRSPAASPSTVIMRSRTSARGTTST
jgi:hypothetical protein